MTNPTLAAQIEALAANGHRRCPWCAGEPKIVAPGRHDVWYRAGCGNDECAVKPFAKEPTIAGAWVAWDAPLAIVTALRQEEEWGMVNRLRDQEADSVTVLCDNPDGPPNNAVECCGFWTGFVERRFEGATIGDALCNAVAAKDAADRDGHPEMDTALRQAEAQGQRYAFGHCKDCPGDHSRMCCKTQTSEGSGVPAEGQYSYETLKLAHDMTHEAATSMGYPSATEALEHLSELRDAGALRQAEGEGEIALPHRPSISLERALEVVRAGDERNWTGAIYDHLRNYAALLENRSDHSLRQAEAAPGVVEALREALRPFVKHWQPWMDDTDANDDGQYNWPDTNEMSCFARVTYGDLRRAREALARQHGARERKIGMEYDPYEEAEREEKKLIAADVRRRFPAAPATDVGEGNNG